MDAHNADSMALPHETGVSFPDSGDSNSSASSFGTADGLEFSPVPHIYRGDDTGYHDELTGRWLKIISPVEEYVYKTVRHERILKYFGNRGRYLELEYHPQGDLWVYLVEHEDLSLATRVKWAVQIAEGIAQLHAHTIVWADAHFRNILVTEDLDVVLCDFAFSVHNPEPLHEFQSMPPPVFKAPGGYWGAPPTHVDIFGFGVMFFALLMNRFPWCADLLPSVHAVQPVWDKHGTNQFETFAAVPQLHEHFHSVLRKCFRADYVTGTELLQDLNCAREAWLRSTL